jgi:hypothetical protein
MEKLEVLKEMITVLLEELDNQHKDSISLGNSKTGEVKVYFDSSKPDEAKEKLMNAIKLLKEHRSHVYGEDKK